MSDQDAKDISAMMSSSNLDVPIVQPKKSKILWAILACMVLGVGLGVMVYQQAAPKPATSPKPSAKSNTTVTPTPKLDTPTVPNTNVVTLSSNTITFPKTGKIRIYSDIYLQIFVNIVLGGQTKNLTIPSRAISASNLMNFGDATFDVTAGSSATFDVYLNGLTGVKMKGWIPPSDAALAKCGANGATVSDNIADLNFVKAKLGGESIFSYQCWEDDDEPGEFNDVYLLWTYVPSTTTGASTSPSASPSLSPSPSPSRAASPSPSPSVSPSPSPSVRASASAVATPTPTPTPSPRVSMPDTSEGTPVTGIFEITVGTISMGLVLLILGIIGLLVL